jgi:hypothetical protein
MLERTSLTTGPWNPNAHSILKSTASESKEQSQGPPVVQEKWSLSATMFQTCSISSDSISSDSISSDRPGILVTAF